MFKEIIRGLLTALESNTRQISVTNWRAFRSALQLSNFLIEDQFTSIL